MSNETEWAGRLDHTSVIFDNKMWVLGGRDNSRFNDVWSSSDGITWTQVTASAAWPKRNSHTSVVFNNKMWVIGGAGGTGAGDTRNDVWSSSDGINWDQATANASWSARFEHTSLVFDNKIWVIGGSVASGVAAGDDRHDIWYSEDGVNWTEADAAASWTVRRELSSLTFDNKMWVLGGTDLSSSSYFNDIWSTDLTNDGFTSASKLTYNAKGVNQHSAYINTTEQDYYRFTLPAGNYTFATIGATDTVCTLFDNSRTEIINNDNDGEDNNCQITHEVTDPTEFFFRIKRGDSNDSIDGYTFKIE
ncbi:MAG: hypothetical protein HAW58_06740 [Candidatus Thioglobus sp.]|nr:hypothetical protein [Candidatus Thioglobus sp.]